MLPLSVGIELDTFVKACCVVRAVQESFVASPLNEFERRCDASLHRRQVEVSGRERPTGESVSRSLTAARRAKETFQNDLLGFAVTTPQLSNVCK